MNQRPTGVFDSGIGGLTVARAIGAMLPAESTVYLGDTARVPYGPKSPSTVRRYARQIVDWLMLQDVKAIVVACNTVTAHALPELQARVDVPVVGVIEPGARAAVKASQSGRIGVIGTAGTVSSGAYRREIVRIDPAADVVEVACPLFVPLVEEGWFTHVATRMIAEEYLVSLRTAGIDTLVLGCTHYPMLKPVLADIIGRDVTLIDSGEETARALARELSARGIAAGGGTPRTQRWAATDDAARFVRVGAMFMGEPPTPVEIVDIERDSAEAFEPGA